MDSKKVNGRRIIKLNKSELRRDFSSYILSVGFSRDYLQIVKVIGIKEQTLGFISPPDERTYLIIHNNLGRPTKERNE